MNRATLDGRGRLTIPKNVREYLDLRSGDRVSFKFEDASVRLRVERRKDLEELKGSLPATREYPGRGGEREAMLKALADRVRR